MSESSRTAVMNKFRDLSAIGQTVMNDIDNVRINTLLAFEQMLSQTNLLRSRTDRIRGEGILARFSVSDMADIDPARTTATLRPDVRAVTLREKGTFVSTGVKEVRFSSNRGSYQQLSNTYKVMSQEGIPTGTFEIEFTAPILGNLTVFDIVTPSADVSVRVSGVSPSLEEFEAEHVSRNGYRVSAWLPRREMRYMRIRITPTHPDITGGIGYTFGLTDLNNSSQTYHLASELVLNPVSMRTSSRKGIFRAVDDQRIRYFLSFDGTRFVEVRPGQEITTGNYFQHTGVTLNGSGKLSAGVTLANPATVAVLNSDGTPLPVVFDLKSGHTPANKCIAERGGELFYLPFDSEEDAGKTFTVRYLTMPDETDVWLKVKLTSDSNLSTPVFSGAYIEEA